MAKIIVQPDCGNAPRKIFLKQFHTDIANGRSEEIAQYLDNDIALHIAGQADLKGKDEVMAALEKQPDWKTREMIIDTIITHGPEAAVKGQLVTKQNKQVLFCHVYKFKGAAGNILKQITSFYSVLPG